MNGLFTWDYEGQGFTESGLEIGVSFLRGLFILHGIMIDTVSERVFLK